MPARACILPAAAGSSEISVDGVRLGGTVGAAPGLQIVIVQPGTGKVTQTIGPTAPMIEASPVSSELAEEA
jgi:hypothetical protein